MTRSRSNHVRDDILEKIGKIWDEQLGRRGRNLDLREPLIPELSAEEREWLVRDGASNLVSRFFRNKVRGLPAYPEVNAQGVHAAQELLSLDEHIYVIRKYVERGDQNYEQANLQADACYRQHGVRPDPRNLCTAVGEE